MAIQTFDALMFTCLLFIRKPLRILVNMSAIGSLKLIFFSCFLLGDYDADCFLPACLHYAWYLAFVGQLSETKPTYLELAIYGPSPSAKLATSVLPYSELLFLLNLVFKGLRRHNYPL
jgi:hypothetical protein